MWQELYEELGDHGFVPITVALDRSGDDVRPALTGSFSCQLADSSVVPCRTVFDMLRESVRGYAPEESSAITWVPADELRRAVRLFATKRPSCLRHGSGSNNTRTPLRSIAR